MGDLPPARPPLSRTASFDPPQRPSPIPHHQTHLSVSGARTNERPIPLDHSACVSLFVSSLKSAREKTRELLAKNGSSTTEQSVQKAGVTLDLSHHRIANIPVEVIELIKDEIERLALAHNQLSTFPNEFASLPRLRYLNLRSNFLKELPPALSRLPALEILDVSRNRLRALPVDLGNLLNLKVLSMSKNRLTTLPSYIADMKDLKIFKVDHNPLVFPPKEVWDNSEPDKDVWLDGVKRFLRQHAERSSSRQNTETGSSDGEGDSESFSLSVSRTASLDSTTDEPDPHSLQTLRPTRSNGGPTAGEISQPKTTLLPTRVRNPSSSSHINIGAGPDGLPSSPRQPETPTNGMSPSQVERHRSNSESTVGLNRDKRRGMPPPPRTGAINKPAFAAQTLRTVDEKTYKHTRGYSHDSVIDGGQVTPHVPAKSPVDAGRRPGQYFRRLSSLPEYKRSSMSSARVGEAARGILYALSTLQSPIEQYTQSTGDSGGPESNVGRALYNSTTHITSLVTALEVYDSKDDESAMQKVIEACQACVAAFRQVLSMLHFKLKDPGMGPGPDIRYARTLLLILYGAHVEIQASYVIIRPLLLAQTVSSNPQSRSASLTSQHSRAAMSVSHTRHNTMSNIDGPPLATPRSDIFTVPPTPGAQPSIHSQNSDSGFDQDDALYQKFQAATKAATQTLPQIDQEIKVTAAQNLQPSITLKLREVSSLCTSGSDTAWRLSSIRWEAVQSGDPVERRKFWDDTNKFTQLVINIAELIKSVTQEYTFPKRVLAAVGTVVRPTKDLYILMNGSAFRHMAETQAQQGAGLLNGFVFQSMVAPMMPATPLSAALGPAAQATVPQIASSGGALGTPVLGGYSRTGTGLSGFTTTMTSVVQEVGAGFSAGLGGRAPTGAKP